MNGISNSLFGKYIDITITNNSDKDVSWTVEDIIVNDITTSCAVVYDVQAGKKGTGEYPFDTEALERYGITDIHTVQLKCELSDSETYDTIENYLSEKLITSLGADFDLSLPINDWAMVFESDSIELYYTGVIEEGTEYDDYKSRTNLMCFNKLDSVISILPEDVSFDGVMDYTNYYSFDVGPKSYGEFYLTCEEDIAEKSEASFRLIGNDAFTYEEIFEIDTISVDMK